MILSFEFKVGSDLKLSWDKADQFQFTPPREGLWEGKGKGPYSQGGHLLQLPLALGYTSWQIKLCVNAGQTKMVPRQPQCLEKRKGNICKSCLGAEWGIVFCFSSRTHSGLAPEWSERFPEINAFESYFSIPLKEILVFSHPYYMGWVSRFCFNHSCLQTVS